MQLLRDMRELTQQRYHDYGIKQKINLSPYSVIFFQFTRGAGGHVSKSQASEVIRRSVGARVCTNVSSNGELEAQASEVSEIKSLSKSRGRYNDVFDTQYSQRRYAVHRTLIIKALLSAVAVLACGHAVAGGPYSSVAPPVITKVMVDAKENALIIAGRHFGATPPTVHLAEHVLKTKRSSEKEIIVGLPAGIQPATYSLTVTSNGHKRATSDVFHAAITK